MIRTESLQSIIGDRAVETSEGQFIESMMACVSDWKKWTVCWR